MARRKRNQKPTIEGNKDLPLGMGKMLVLYLEDLAVKNFSAQTVDKRRCQINEFIRWAAARSLDQVNQIERPILQRYQRYLFYYRTKNDKPLSFRTQHVRLSSLRNWFKWLTRNNYLMANPASELELPKIGRPLPKDILNEKETEAVLAVPDVKTPLGLRDRAIMETIYSSGIRRQEAVNLDVYDLDVIRVILRIRHGKGNKDRVVPIGDRALAWVQKYQSQVRPGHIDYSGFLKMSPHGALALRRADDWEHDTGVGTDPWIVTDLYCEAARKYPQNGWLKGACDTSGDIDNAIRLIDFMVYRFKTYDSAAADKSKWFKCTRTCLQKRWFDAVKNQEDGTGLLPGSEWGDWCKKCTLNFSSIACCKEQVKAEQTELQNCFASCGQWNYGDSFPINMIPGFEGDFNDLQTRIKFGNEKCCTKSYYPDPADDIRYKRVIDRLGYDPRHQPWGFGPKY